MVQSISQEIEIILAGLASYTDDEIETSLNSDFEESSFINGLTASSLYILLKDLQEPEITTQWVDSEGLIE